MLEPDFGTGFILTLTILSMILISGIKKRYTFIAILIGVMGFVVLILSAPYRLERIFAYLDPYDDPLGSGFQIIQSLYAISPNGFFGRGLFKSFQKYYFLPEPQTEVSGSTGRIKRKVALLSQKCHIHPFFKYCKYKRGVGILGRKKA